MKKMKFNRNHPIGQVIYVVEGEKTEVSLLKHIFTTLLPYTMIEVKKDGTDILHFKDDTSRRNQIYVVVGKRPQLVGLIKDREYFEDAYNRLNYEFHLRPDQSALYYLFDRDRDSNSKDIAKELLKKLINSRENNDFDMNGTLLMSYPCIEAFLFNAKEEESYHSCGKNIKHEVYENKYYIDTINEQEILYATELMIKIINKIRGFEFEMSELDNLKYLNLTIFDYEEREFFKNSTYRTLSLLGLSFLDLGIIGFET